MTKTECEVCGRSGKGAHTPTGCWGSAVCYRLGFTRLRTALADAEKSLAVVTQERDEARGLAESRAEAARLRGQAAHEAQAALAVERTRRRLLIAEIEYMEHRESAYHPISKCPTCTAGSPVGQHTRKCFDLPIGQADTECPRCAALSPAEGQPPEGEK